MHLIVGIYSFLLIRFCEKFGVFVIFYYASKPLGAKKVSILITKIDKKIGNTYITKKSYILFFFRRFQFSRDLRYIIIDEIFIITFQLKLSLTKFSTLAN